MKGHPRISVLMPVYNGEMYLEQAVRSILDQTFEDIELIVGNDGSTDKTLDILRSIDDDRIRVFTNEENKGIVFTRNKLFELAKANYTAIIDSDDISKPERLERQYVFFESHQDHSVCGTWSDVIDSEGRIKNSWSFKQQDREIRTEFLFGNHMVTSSVMINRKAVPIDLLFDSDYPVSEDFHLWARIAKAGGKFHILPEVLTQYRGHDQGISKTKRQLILQKIFNVVLWQLGNFVDNMTDLDRSIHYAVCGNTSEKADFSIADLMVWIEKLIGSNHAAGYVDHQLLVERLHDRSYEYLRKYESAAGSLRAVIGFKYLTAGKRWYFLKSLLKDRFSK